MAGENDDLENRLKKATAEDARQMLEEFLESFYLDKSQVAADRPVSKPSDPELDKVTFKGHMTV